MNADFYRSYQTAEWQRLKNQVLERDNYTCQICGETHGLMHVHHITYKRCYGYVYNSPLGDLITLCEHCHSGDDGDHQHFFNGKVVLACGFHGNKPSVVRYSEIQKASEWYGCEYQIISFRFDYKPYRCIGFRTEGDWFPYLLNADRYGDLWVEDEWHVLENGVVEQRSADVDEVIDLVRSVDKQFRGFKRCIMCVEGVYFVNPERYKYITCIRKHIKEIKQQITHRPDGAVLVERLTYLYQLDYEFCSKGQINGELYEASEP